MPYSIGHQQCAMDNGCKQATAFKCRGCQKDFCCKHVTDHRRTLTDEMSAIISEHDHLKNIFLQHPSNPNLHPSIRQIDDWEKEYLAKIRLKATELRRQLLQPAETQINQLSKRLEALSVQLNEARKLNDFIEIDLSLWKHHLDLINADLISPLNFTINQDTKNPLVRNISIVLKKVNERFDRVFDAKVRIIEDGEVVVRDISGAWAEIWGKNEYSSGCHKIRLRIESAMNSNLMLGINSTATALQSTSYKSKSACLWQSTNHIYSNGVGQANSSSPPIEMKKNDIITLIFDCGNRKISMINERTNAKHEQTIDVDKCRFPWQLHVNMAGVKESVRILPS